MTPPDHRRGPDAGRPADDQADAPAGGRRGTAASPVRVLVVDDHAGVRRGIVRLIGSSTEFAVVGEAADGDEAVKAASRVAADVVLMDVSMPVLDGVMATRQVAALPLPVTPAIVLFTAWADRGRIAEALACGASGFVLKDAPPAELFQALRDALAGCPPGSRPADAGEAGPGRAGPPSEPAQARVIPITRRGGARRWQIRVAGGAAAMVVLGSAGVAAAGQGRLPAPMQAAARFVGLPTPPTRLDDARRALSRLDAALRNGDPVAIAAAVDGLEHSAARLDADDRARLGAAPVLASAERRLTADPAAGAPAAPGQAPAPAPAPDDHGGASGPGQAGGDRSRSEPDSSGRGPSGPTGGDSSGSGAGSGSGSPSGGSGSSGPSPTTPATVAPPSGGQDGPADGGGGGGSGGGSSPSGGAPSGTPPSGGSGPGGFGGSGGSSGKGPGGSSEPGGGGPSADGSGNQSGPGGGSGGHGGGG